MSLVTNFFGNLRKVAITLEKETEKLDQVFINKEEDYDDESPMRVLHNLRSEIKDLKNELQTTIDKKHLIGQELHAFIRVCKVLQQRTSTDIQQIKDSFQNYGYTPLSTDKSDAEVSNENVKSENEEQISHDSEADELPSMPTVEKPSNSWDLLRGPQLSDFGLSHYQLSSAWDLQSSTLHVKKPVEENGKPIFKDIRTVNMAKTPKCALRMEDDFTQVAHFGISESNTNFNDDYTIALINKKAQKKASTPKKDGTEGGYSRNLKTFLATPSHPPNRTEFDIADSPMPPVFVTPGLKVHRKNMENVSTYETKPLQSEDADEDTEIVSLTKNLKHGLATPAHFTLKSNDFVVDSPLPPAFCTPGLNVQKKEIPCIVVGTSIPKETEKKATPPIPAFQSNWLNRDTTRQLDITEPIPRPVMTHNLYLQDNTLVLNSDKYYENSTKMASPPQMKTYSLDTPQRPEITMSLTEDLLKYNVKPSSPPKMSEYESLLWTPTRPEMTSCITEDISQILSRYCDNKMNHLETVGGNKDSFSSSRGSVSYTNKENRF
ncbi:spindle and kinetochore-associated 3 isoform X1 [Pelobates cultripes]|uniref:Spindle and kinetochore-associated 3 isoform X1 n=1 Tax=Pelobates cultripes TaxID=61616 RepID=A0AAD1R7S2_PELCU|nr:spindle and kinetochore-associated 3 isoform X1 [Pelobates cultripes]